MKRLTLLACAGLLVAAMAAPSFAADLPRPAYKAPVYTAPFSWSGFYVGINGGYGWSTSKWSSAVSSGSTDPNGGLVGLTLGYNLQTGNWVWGLEGDIDASWMKGSTKTGTGVCAGVIGCESKTSWYATTRGRIGYAFDHWLPYFTAGGAYTDLKMTPNTAISQTDTRIGWTVGAGLEWAFLGNWSTKIEYLYADLGKSSCSVAACGTATDVSLTTNIFKVGVNYRF